MKFLHVVGARPNFMKVAPILAQLRKDPRVRQVLVHTGQHYDPKMSDVFFQDLGMPAPDAHLGAGSGSHAQQTAKIMVEVEPVILRENPDVVVVAGDVNSTVAVALVAAKLGVAVAHIEAGLRSWDWRMPEEVNRVLTDHLSELLLCPSQTAADNLARERAAGRVELVGDVMVDVARLFAPRARERLEVLEDHGVAPDGYVLATAHRAGTVDDPDRLRALVEVLTGLPLPVVLPLHPRTRARLEAAGLLDRLDDGVRLAPPLGSL